MTSCTIRGIPINFPFEPYELQKNYMEKVIDCIQNRFNGVLESPTGTGKTLSLLCSSLAWLEVKKAQIQAQRVSACSDNDELNFLKDLKSELDSGAGTSQSSKAFLGMPTIIYASRTHSQLSQAMKELKRTSYTHMRASVLGSREQMCIHPEVMNEQTSAMKINLCCIKVKSKSCHFYNKVDRKKDDPNIFNNNIVDIEDIVKLGQSHKFCPYYMAKELKQSADIIFMPYNYLLDPKARKALGVELVNNVIILDEAHNVEKMCEDSASLQLKSTDITLAIEEITAVMKALTEEVQAFSDEDAPKDFTADELCVLKQMFLDFEKELDKVQLGSGPEGTTFEGNYIFEMLSKAGINDGNHNAVAALLDKLIQFLTTVTEGPFQRKGAALQLFSDLLIIAFAEVSPEFKQKIQRCYKVHIALEEQKKRGSNNWLVKATSKMSCRVLSYWCFSPGFGMNTLMEQGVHCVILTSGTLAPLKPLISELELQVDVRLENPHIVKGDQVCVKILTKGPDMEVLNSNYQNRDNPKYISSLGRTILNLTRIIPSGILIFFPSYPIMSKSQQCWQESGIWGSINEQKTIFVEPRDKNSFNTAMKEYYAKVNDPQFKGAIFMAVIRGKVSEGLDFADNNGRAVFITGLPYPPLKDPRIVLKRRYLDACNAKDKDFLRGDDWYSLEASRAVNQAIGRVIRHQYDYGAIILLDSRFNSPRIKAQMSVWLQQHIKVVQNFGEIIRDLRGFFRNAQEKLPEPKSRAVLSQQLPAVFDTSTAYRKGNFDFSTSSVSTSSDESLVNIHKRTTETLINPSKRKKISLVPNPDTATSLETSIREYIVMVKGALDDATFKGFLKAMTAYRSDADFDVLKNNLDRIFLSLPKVRFIIPGLEPYIKERHKAVFEAYCEAMR